MVKKGNEGKETCPEGQNLCFNSWFTGHCHAPSQAFLPAYITFLRAKFSSLYKLWASSFAVSARRLGVSKEGRYARDKPLSFIICFRTILTSSSNEIIWGSSLLPFSVPSAWIPENLSGKNQSLNNANCLKTFLIKLWILLILLSVMIRLFCIHRWNNGTSVSLLALRSEREQENKTHIEKSTLQNSSSRN